MCPTQTRRKARSYKRGWEQSKRKSRDRREYNQAYYEANRPLSQPRRPKVACRSGHKLTPDNVYVYPSGKRSCLQCKREASRRARQRVTAEQRAAWLVKNRDRIPTYSATRRARRRGAFVEVVDRRVVFERDKGICGICAEKVAPEDYHVDHVIPLSRGGEHSYANSQLAHPACNLQKSADVGSADRARPKASSQAA